MNELATAKEAWLVEAIGGFAQLLDRVELLQSALDESSSALVAAQDRLADQLAGFEGRVSSITENAKTQTIRYLAVKTDEATRRTIDHQSRAMADAARVALGAEIGAMMQRWQAMLQPLMAQRRTRSWEAWLTHAAAAVVASGATWGLAWWVW